MLSRLIARPLHFRGILTLTLVSSSNHPLLTTSPPPPTHPPRFPPPNPNSCYLLQSSRALSSNQGGGGGGGDGGNWNLTPEADEGGSVFGEEEGNLSGITEGGGDAFGSEAVSSTITTGRDVFGGDFWSREDRKGDIFDDIDREVVSKKDGVVGGGDDGWLTAEGYKPWSLGDDEEKRDVFGIGEEGEQGLEGIGDGGIEGLEEEAVKEKRQLEEQEQQLLTTLKGPNRAFGDLIAASGITEDMIDSLILLKDVRGVKGLPPLTEIEDKAIAKMNATSTRGEIERKKQEEIAKARVRQVDEKGRAYGTGRRKCGIARVWIQPGDGKFIINDKQFDVYFPSLDHRAALLRPFTETKTLGLWDVTCTVKGGGLSGQVGAIRLGISRALQNWEPGLRPYLKSAGFLTRDPRVVERKKPGKAKARKSFQWVKR